VESERDHSKPRGKRMHIYIVKERKRHLLIITAPYTLKLIEDAIILIQIAQLATEMIVDRNSLDGLRFHVDVPDLE